MNDWVKMGAVSLITFASTWGATQARVDSLEQRVERAEDIRETVIRIDERVGQIQKEISALRRDRGTR